MILMATINYYAHNTGWHWLASVVRHLVCVCWSYQITGMAWLQLLHVLN